MLVNKNLLFGELIKLRPFHGTKQRWTDVVNNALKTLDVPPKEQYALTNEQKKIVWAIHWKMFGSNGYPVPM